MSDTSSGLRLIGSDPRISVSVSGEGDPVVFLHGIGGNHRNWNLQRHDLETDYQVVAFDFRGYGDSGPIGETFDFFAFVDDVEIVLDGLGIGCCHLIGCSMGGLVAQAFYAQHPERVRSLGLIACRPGSAPVFEQSAQFEEERLRPLENDGSAETLAEMLLPKLVGPAASAEALAAIRDSLLRLHPPHYRKIVKARLRIPPFLRLADISVPTLVVGSTHDQVAPLAQMQAMAAEIPNADFVVIHDAGHLMNIEKSEQFNAALRHFLTAVKAKQA